MLVVIGISILAADNTSIIGLIVKKSIVRRLRLNRRRSECVVDQDTKADPSATLWTISISHVTEVSLLHDTPLIRDSNGQ